MKRNVYIVELGSGYFLPYVYGLLRVYAEEDPLVSESYSFQQPFFLNDPARTIVDRMEQPAVVGLSCYVWNFRRQMKVARLMKEHHPDALVVAGGPHIPDGVDGFFEVHPYVDILVHGEGEAPFQEILRENLVQTPDWSRIPGVTFTRAKQVVSVPRSRLDIAQCARSPYVSGYLDEAIEIFRRLKINYNAAWETNRGCPYSCSFCDWGSSTLSKIRQFPLDRLMEDIRYFGAAKIPYVHINDANFGILPRDRSISDAIVNMRMSTGFPKEVRLNFAKNSNERVFEISHAWTQAGILNSTTLSMQAVNPGVLKAVDRENIGVNKYKELHKKYSQAEIATYTEIILGLPTETKDTFKQGLGEIFEMGNHDDLRVYELGLLPNAPMSNPTVVQKYGLRAIDKQLNLWPGEIPEDEREFISTVIETSSMSKADWVDMEIYSRLLQLLHNGCYTRYLAIHMWQHYNVPYHEFYSQLQEFFLARPRTLIGLICHSFKDYYEQYQKDTQTTRFQFRYIPPEAMQMIGQCRTFVTPVLSAWLIIASRLTRFYEELQVFLRIFPVAVGAEIQELLRFQHAMMLTPDYDPLQGKNACYSYDFPSALLDGAPLEKREIKVHFRDTHMGVSGQYPLEKGNLAAFVGAAIGDWAGATHRYQHQLHRAEILYVESSKDRVAAC